MRIAVIYFLNGYWLWITIGLLLLYTGLLWRSSVAREKWMTEFAGESANLISTSHSPRRRFFKNALLALVIALFGLALARPQWGMKSEQAGQAEGDDVIFLLDISRSMLAEDVKPNRLERAKFAVLDYMRTQKSGRMGLVVFAGNAFLRCPLTLDLSGFEESVTSANPDDLHVQGTDLGNALAVARTGFEKNDKRRLIVLLTDGEDLQKDGIKAAEEFSKEGTVIFTVGVGSDAGSSIMLPDPQGGKRPMLDENGEPVVSRLDEETLKKIAEATGGSYHRLDRIGAAMSGVHRAAQTVDAKTISTRMKHSGIDRFEWFLAAGILLLIVESLLSTRKRQKNFVTR